MNLPNKLTVGRIVMVPIMTACFFIPRDIVPYWNYIAAGVFIVAFITDILDGAIARKQNIVSDFGKLMDPIADKLLTASALIMLVSAFAGYESTMNAYKTAVEEKYRFFSFGDAMLIL